MSRSGNRKKARQSNLTRRRLGVQSLEPRQMLTTAFSLPDAFSAPIDSFSGIGSSGTGPAVLGSAYGNSGDFYDFRPDVRADFRPDVRPDFRPDVGHRVGPWYSQLSPVVRHSIEHGQDLSQFSRVDLESVRSWAVVTEDRVTAIDLFRKIKPKSVQSRTDLFGDQIRVHVWEVELNRGSHYQQLSELTQEEQGHRILDIIPLFFEHNEADGTLNPAAVTDPNFPAQWHLDATASSTQWGIDAEGAWSSSTGEGVTVAIVDTRQQFNHPDLAGNNNAALNYDDANRDWNGDGIGDNNPNVFLPGGSPNWPGINDSDLDFDGILEADLLRQQSHGTAVAGIAIGDDDGTGIVGVAPDATYAAFNFLENPTQSIANTFSAANIAPIDVFNNSWGAGNTRQFRYGSFLDLQAVQNAATNGIFVKAAGNNRDANGTYNGWDRSNFDQLHMRQAIIVAATQQSGRVEWYSNPGSNNLVSAPVNRTGGGNTWTADVTDVLANAGDNRGYSDGNMNAFFNGTSAAAPMVSGVTALMLESNPNLDWRNTQHILVDTAQKNGLIDFDGDGIIDGGDGNSDGIIDNFNLRNTFAGNANYDTDLDGNGLIDLNGDGLLDGNVDPYHTGWFQNAAGNWVSDDFGFGIVDAQAAVQAAAAWTQVPAELSVDSLTKTITTGVLAEGNLGGLGSVNNIDTFFTESNLTVEWVEVTINASVADQSDLMLVLQSPSGTQSVLMAAGGTSAQVDIANFTFNTNQFWDESASGVWTLQALDTGVGDGQASTINDWQISIYGTCDVESPLLVSSMAHPLASLDNFASLALSAGGLEPDSYVINYVNQVGESLSMGVFSNGAASGLPLDQGLLFTSGKVVDAIGPNDKTNTTTVWSNPGHPLLNELTGQVTHDASGLEIYFTPTDDVTISYDFLFGSEEFDEWVGSDYNDGAGIFIAALKSPSDGYQNGFPPGNVAQTYNGADLAVNQLATKSENGGASGKYYDPNPWCCGDMNWEYDGSSLLSHSSPITLKAGANYYIGMMVADASDGAYDSALAIGLDGSGGTAGELFNMATKPFPFPTDTGPFPFEFKQAEVFRQQVPSFILLLESKDHDLLGRQRVKQLDRIPAATVDNKITNLDAWKVRDRDHAQRRESLAPEHVDALLREFDSVKGMVRFEARPERAS